MTRRRVVHEPFRMFDLDVFEFRFEQIGLCARLAHLLDALSLFRDAFTMRSALVMLVSYRVLGARARLAGADHLSFTPRPL